MLLPEQPFSFDRGTLMSIRLKHNLRKSSRNIGRFRLSVSSIPDPAQRCRSPGTAATGAGNSFGAANGRTEKSDLGSIPFGDEAARTCAC